MRRGVRTRLNKAGLNPGALLCLAAGQRTGRTVGAIGMQAPAESLSTHAQVHPAPRLLYALPQTKFSAVPLPEQLRTSVSYKVTKPPRESLEPLTLELETASVCLSAPATCSAPRSYRAEKVPVTYTRSCERLPHSCCNRPMSLHTCCYFCWGGWKNSNWKVLCFTIKIHAQP